MHKPSSRLKRLIDRRNRIHLEGKCDQYHLTQYTLAFLWDSRKETDKRYQKYMDADIIWRGVGDINVGSHLGIVRVDYPFPIQDLPSRKFGLRWSAENWADDFEFMIDHHEAEIYPDELIVGEAHWELDWLRPRVFPGFVEELGIKAREMGAGGGCVTHTCPDLSIGLKEGFGGILKKIRETRQNYEIENICCYDADKVSYLKAAEKVCLTMIRFVKKHELKARFLMDKATDVAEKDRLAKVAEVCRNISEKPPSTFHEAVQWLWFYVMFDRMMMHANGNGRIDLLLNDFLIKDLDESKITEDEARELLAELLLKYSGAYWSVGGRDKNMKDATNKTSWLLIEAYNMIGGPNTIGVMWHSDMDKKFFNYAVQVAVKHGTGALSFVNYDVMRESEIYFGVDPEDAWSVAYSGCQWYCIPGKEYRLHDTSILWLPVPLLKAVERSEKEESSSFSEFCKIYTEELEKAFIALKNLLDAQDMYQSKVWPEIVTSLFTHGCIEEGKDITDGCLKYTERTVNFAGLANAVDSLYTIKKLIFEERKFNFSELNSMLKSNWLGYESVRDLILELPKFGNDIDDVDELAVYIQNEIEKITSKYRNFRGKRYIPSLFSWMCHAAAGAIIGPTPDGRKREEPMAQGPNPQHGRARSGITSLIHSLTKLDYKRVIGGPWQFECDPSLLGDETNRSKNLQAVIESYFEKGGIQVNVNIVSLQDLIKAMENPDSYQHLVVRVTAQPALFIKLDKKIQEEIIARMRGFYA